MLTIWVEANPQESLNLNGLTGKYVISKNRSLFNDAVLFSSHFEKAVFSLCVLLSGCLGWETQLHVLCSGEDWKPGLFLLLNFTPLHFWLHAHKTIRRPLSSSILILDTNAKACSN